MPDTLNSSELRQWASRCQKEAADKWCAPDDRERLLIMSKALLELANNADWLEGKRTTVAA